MNKLAQGLRVPANRISSIIAGRRAMMADTALRLSRFFGTSPEFWLGLQAEYDLDVARLEAAKRIEREVQPRAS